MCIFIFLAPNFIFITSPKFTLRSVTQLKGALYLWRVQIQIWFGSEYYFANSLLANPSRISHQTIVGWKSDLLKCRQQKKTLNCIKADLRRPALTQKLKCRQLPVHKNVSSHCTVTLFSNWPRDFFKTNIQWNIQWKPNIQWKGWKWGIP